MISFITIHFRFSRKSGIKSSTELLRIKNNYKSFRVGSDLISSCEAYFGVNIAIIENENSRKVLEKKSFTQKKLKFSRKPKKWNNLVLFSEESQNLYYMRYQLDEIIPFLSESDCVLQMPQSDIFARFGMRFEDTITEESIEIIEEQLKDS